MRRARTDDPLARDPHTTTTRRPRRHLRSGDPGSTSHAVSLLELNPGGGVVLTLKLPRYRCVKATPNREDNIDGALAAACRRSQVRDHRNSLRNGALLAARHTPSHSPAASAKTITAAQAATLTTVTVTAISASLFSSAGSEARWTHCLGNDQTHPQHEAGNHQRQEAHLHDDPGDQR